MGEHRIQFNFNSKGNRKRFWLLGALCGLLILSFQNCHRVALSEVQGPKNSKAEVEPIPQVVTENGNLIVPVESAPLSIYICPSGTKTSDQVQAPAPAPAVSPSPTTAKVQRKAPSAKGSFGNINYANVNQVVNAPTFAFSIGGSARAVSNVNNSAYINQSNTGSGSRNINYAHVNQVVNAPTAAISIGGSASAVSNVSNCAVINQSNGSTVGSSSNAPTGCQQGAAPVPAPAPTPAPATAPAPTPSPDMAACVVQVGENNEAPAAQADDNNSQMIQNGHILTGVNSVSAESCGCHLVHCDSANADLDADCRQAYSAKVIGR